MIEVPLSRNQVRQLRKYFKAVEAAAMHGVGRRLALMGQPWRFGTYRTKDRRAGPLLRVVLLTPEQTAAVYSAIRKNRPVHGHGIPRRRP